MTYLHACVGCALNTPDCTAKALLRDALKGLGVTSIKHKCASRVHMFARGAPVLIRTYGSNETESEWDDGPVICDYPGVFIEQKGAKGIAFIKEGTIAVDDPGGVYPFEPKSGGYVKISLSRMRPNPDGQHTKVDECRYCASCPTLTGRCDNPGTPVRYGCLLPTETENQMNYGSDGSGGW